MSKIKINELKARNNKSHLQDLSDLETINIIGGYEEETESSKEIIQKAMQDAVMRSDLLSNSNITEV